MAMFLITANNPGGLNSTKKKKQELRNSQVDISLLSVECEIIATVILNGITADLINNVYPGYQCGFRAGRGVTDMIYCL